MPGFRNIKEWVESATDDGKCWTACFRKVPPSAATIAGQWFDYSTATGIPVANFYATEPLVAATIDIAKGIYVPRSVSPEKQFLLRATLMSGAAAVTTTTSQNQLYLLMDYLLYYPFIDLDAAGDEQVLTNTVTLPRYTDGKGVMMMMVSQAMTAGGGNFSVSYTNHEGTPGRTSGTAYCAASQPSGALVSSVSADAGISPFIPLQSGDLGVRSVQSVTVGVNNGGLAAIVLVRPLQFVYVREECRRPTSSPTQSYGDAAEVERIRMLSGTPQIKDGAVLAFIGRHAAGSVASQQLVGTLDTVWR